MGYSINNLLDHINCIREEIGHEKVNIDIKEIIFNESINELWIITNDRPDKSAIIGKGGWVVGRLREELNINSIHVECYSDFLLKKYRMSLSLDKLKSFIKSNKLDDDSVLTLSNLIDLLTVKLDNLYSFNFKSYFDDLDKNFCDYPEASKSNAIVALSGGTDSSFSLIVAKKLGFNPIAITVDPGTIVLPNQFKQNIDKLISQLNINHEYISVDYSEIISESLSGRFHPCGRCSKIIENTVYEFANKNNIPIVIFGDMLATGSQCITEHYWVDDNNNENKLIRLNLPAALSVAKLENKSLTKEYDLIKFKGFGCPLLYEVHKKYPHMKKYSIQRILRETRSGALEPGEALNLIWSFYNTN